MRQGNGHGPGERPRGGLSGGKSRRAPHGPRRLSPCWRRRSPRRLRSPRPPRGAAHRCSVASSGTVAARTSSAPCISPSTSTPRSARRDAPRVALTVVHLAVPPGRPVPGIRPGTLPLDQQIGERARARGIPIEGLESILDHLQVLSRMPRKEGVEMVEEALANPAANRDALATLVGAYIAEDDRPLLKAFGQLARRKPALAERLLYRRNQAWCERLMNWLRDGRMFVAAGAAHMFGDRGLVTLLRERGYLVERVRPTAASPSTSVRTRG